MQRLLATMMMLLMTTAALAGCAGSDITQADVDAAKDEGYAEGVAVTEAKYASTLDEIMTRGTLNCGVKTSQYGMGYYDADSGERSGLDVAYCQAIAAALGVTVTYIDATDANTRFSLLESEAMDVLIRTTTWTTSRDAGLNADFAGINFYDGQGVLVSENSFSAATAGNSVTGLDGANICVGTGTTTEGNLQDYFAFHGISFNAVNVQFEVDAVERMKDGTCDVFTGDKSAIGGRKVLLDAEDNSGNSLSGGIWMASETLSKEPLAAATRDNDDDWNDVVTWVWHALVTAEEFGITAANADQMATDSAAADSTLNPRINTLLNTNPENSLGTETNLLSSTWALDAIKAVGNYGEAYAAAFCNADADNDGTSDYTYDGLGAALSADPLDSSNCWLPRAGSQNALVGHGGLMFAPPIK